MDPSDSDAEWEDEIENERITQEKDILPHLRDKPDNGDNKCMEIAVPMNVPKARKKQNFYDKAMAAFEKQGRINIHKVHLLCLLSHGLTTSKQCNDVLLQSLMVSMTPSSIVLTDNDSIINDNTLPILLKWFSSSTDALLEVIKEHSDLFDREFYDVQLLVSLLRGLGVRARIILALKVSPLKTKTSESAKKRTTSNKSDSIETTPISSDNTDTLFIPSNTSEDGPVVPSSSSKKRKSKEINKQKKKLKQYKYSSPSKQSTTSPYFRRSKRKRRQTNDSLASETSPVQSSNDDFRSIAKKIKESLSPVTMETESTPSSVVSEEDTNDSPVQLLYNSTSSWVEVQMKGKWVCLHIPSVSIDQRSVCEKQCPYKLEYVIGIDNDCLVSDVTGRYALQWCTATLKNRVDENWWTEALRPFAPPIKERELEEEDITGILLSQPLPVTMSDYKGHPLNLLGQPDRANSSKYFSCDSEAMNIGLALKEHHGTNGYQVILSKAIASVIQKFLQRYVLKRHLLKFEVIYPEESDVLGYFKGEPVFSRSCVHTLHTRETWLKEARLVRKNEKPHKVVKGRKRKGQTSLEAESNTAEVFGVWQTEDYVPPPVVDGKVTRNEYGNIELFKPSMLPRGAIHMTASGIAKVARKLNIDYAPAMMGWDHHCGYCHPIIDGIVVAEEFHNILMEAWSQEQQILLEKDIKKKEKRSLQNWKKLIKGLLIIERVKKRFECTQQMQGVHAGKDDN